MSVEHREFQIATKLSAIPETPEDFQPIPTMESDPIGDFLFGGHETEPGQETEPAKDEPKPEPKPEPTKTEPKPEPEK